jgi:glucose-6-phosphate 1-epimerase
MSERVSESKLGALNLSVIENDNSRLEISHYGAQVISWNIDGKEVLFSNPNIISDKSKALRAGAPICFPWFNKGVSFGRELKPSHGSARISEWEKVSNSPLTFCHTTNSHLDLPLQLEVQYVLQERSLKIDFRVENLSSEEENEFELALHTYFATSVPEKTQIVGILDAVQSFTPRLPIDQIFLNLTNQIKLSLSDFEVDIENFHFAKSVIWHPGLQHGITDLQDNEDLAPFICLESLSDIIVLPPSSGWSASVSYAASIARNDTDKP